MRRPRVLIPIGVAVCIAALVGWVLDPPHALSIEAESVRRVEVQFDPWGEENTRRPGASSEDREAITELVAVIRTAQRTTEHKCGSRGSIAFRDSIGLPAKLEFLPGHHPEWYEIRTGGQIYKLPRREFVEAMRRIGVDVPLECQ